MGSEGMVHLVVEIKWNAMGRKRWNGKGREGMEWDGMRCDGMRRDGSPDGRGVA